MTNRAGDRGAPSRRELMAGGAALLGAGDQSRGRKEYELAQKMDPDSESRAVVAPLFESTARK